MILRFALLGLLSTTTYVNAFAPTKTFTPRTTIRQQAIIDPNLIHDLHAVPQHLDTASSFFSSITLSDATDALVDAVTSSTPEPVASTAAAVVDAASTAAPAATEAVANDNGWFGFLAGPIESLLAAIHGGLVSVGMSADSWGISIIAMTIFIKIVTYPLTYSQLENTTKMQTLNPKIKEIQAKYQSNPEVMNQKMAEFYQENEFNPLAGCVPTLVQLPVLVGLYRSVLNLAKENKLDEPFLFLPNLEGPTYGADPSHTTDWLFQWTNGVPPLGWEDTTSFLILPLVLLVTQFLSMELMAPKDQEQPAFVKFIPFMISFFSLGVPAALSVYWVANNIITTTLSLQIRSTFDTAAPAMTGGGAAGASVVDVQASTFTPAPMREKPAGFGATDWGGDDGVKPITDMDAEVVEAVVEEEAAAVPSAADLGVPGRGKKKNRGKKKKKKRN